MFNIVTFWPVQETYYQEFSHILKQIINFQIGFRVKFSVYIYQLRLVISTKIQLHLFAKLLSVKANCPIKFVFST